MASFSPSEGLAAAAAGGAVLCTACESESWGGEVERVDAWSKLLAVAEVGVTGLVGEVVEADELWLGSPSLVRFFLRKPRLGIKTLRPDSELCKRRCQCSRWRGWRKRGGGRARRAAHGELGGALGSGRWAVDSGQRAGTRRGSSRSLTVRNGSGSGSGSPKFEQWKAQKAKLQASQLQAYSVAVVLSVAHTRL